nr:MAG TPA: 104 kDa microneme/rhoptry antigen [Caudoviricetes sp.]
MPPNRRLRQALHRLPNIAHIMRRTTRRWGSEIVCCRHSPSFTRGGRKPHIRACCMNHNPVHRTIRAGRVMRRRNVSHNTPPPNTTITATPFYLLDDIVTIGDGFTPWQAAEPDTVETTPSLYFTTRLPPEQCTDTTERPSLPSLPSLPSDPFTPAGPRSPRSPCTPCGPAGPEGPTSPRSPAEPSRPSAPLTPSAPARPGTPSRPSDPFAPGNPSGPFTPFKPGEPCGPTGPTSPAEPLTPSRPSAPAGPCGPRTPAGPGTPCTLRSVRIASTHKPDLCSCTDSTPPWVHTCFTRAAKPLAAVPFDWALACSESRSEDTAPKRKAPAATTANNTSDKNSNTREAFSKLRRCRFSSSNSLNPTHLHHQQYLSKTRAHQEDASAPHHQEARR